MAGGTTGAGPFRRPLDLLGSLAPLDMYRKGSCEGSACQRTGMVRKTSVGVCGSVPEGPDGGPIPRLFGITLSKRNVAGDKEKTFVGSFGADTPLRLFP